MFRDAHHAATLPVNERREGLSLRGKRLLDVAPGERSGIVPLGFEVRLEPGAAVRSHGQTVALPAPVVEAFSLTDGRTIRVVRDDLLPGGTKTRALVTMMRAGFEYVYASPAEGYAQIAAPCAARLVGAMATVFVAARVVPHRNTAKAREYGAQIAEVRPGYLHVVQARAAAYCAGSGAILLPFGLDVPEARMAIAAAASTIPAPSEAWCVAGSGTLSRALALAWPNARINAVQVGRAPDVGGARLFAAPERFAVDAAITPPFPSCRNYDAKAWRFIEQHASDGALFWNVGA